MSATTIFKSKVPIAFLLATLFCLHAEDLPSAQELSEANRIALDLRNDDFDKRESAVRALEKLFQPPTKDRVHKWEAWRDEKVRAESDPEVKAMLKRASACKRFEFTDTEDKTWNCTAYLDNGTTWVLHGICKLNGGLTSVYPYKDGVLDGRVTLTRRDSGLLYKDSHYQNGLLDGAFISYYSNGNKETEGNFRNGKKIGVWTHFGRNRNVLGTYTIDNGNGYELWFHENGKVARKSQLKNGNKDGLEEEWDPEGTFVATASYKYFPDIGQSLADGLWKRFNDNGKFEYELSFANGLPTNGFVENARVNGKFLRITVKDGVVSFTKDNVNLDGPANNAGQIFKPWFILNMDFEITNSRFTKICFMGSQIEGGKVTDPLAYDPQSDFRNALSRFQK